MESNNSENKNDNNNIQSNNNIKDNNEPDNKNKENNIKEEKEINNNEVEKKEQLDKNKDKIDHNVIVINLRYDNELLIDKNEEDIKIEEFKKLNIDIQKVYICFI
jgi:hypothetical protein